MNYGKKKKVDVRVDLSEYQDLHKQENCQGEFAIHHILNSCLDSSTLGPIQLPAIPMVACPKCRASFIAPEFEEWVEQQIAEHMVSSNGSLTKKQLRFLRQFFDLTQEEVAHLIGVSDRHEIAKMESSTNPRQMDLDKQLRLKLQYAKILEISDIETILSLATPAERPVEISSEWFSETEIKKKFAG